MDNISLINFLLFRILYFFFVENCSIFNHYHTNKIFLFEMLFLIRIGRVITDTKSYFINDKDRDSQFEEWKSTCDSINFFLRDLDDRVAQILCLKYRKQRHDLERFISV